MRCGDTIKHSPSGETWTLAYVNGENVSWVGWPAGEAYRKDCTLIEACSDAEHVKMLRRLETANCEGSDRRSLMARRELEAMASKITGAQTQKDHFFKLRDELTAVDAERARVYAIYLDASDRAIRLEAQKREALRELIEAAYPSDKAA